MFKENLVTLILLGGSALTFLTLTSSEHINWRSTTVPLAQVVEEFNSTKDITARGWKVPAQILPEITQQEVLVSLGRQFASSDTEAEQLQTLEAAIRTQRLPACSYIRVSKTDAVASRGGVQLEICVNRCEKGDWLAGDRIFAVPIEL